MGSLEFPGHINIPLRSDATKSKFLRLYTFSKALINSPDPEKNCPASYANEWPFSFEPSISKVPNPRFHFPRAST